MLGSNILQSLNATANMFWVSRVLGEAGVSIDRMRQYGHADGTAPVLIVTHKTTRDAIDLALAGFAATGVMVGEAVALRIEPV